MSSAQDQEIRTVAIGMFLRERLPLACTPFSEPLLPFWLKHSIYDQYLSALDWGSCGMCYDGSSTHRNPLPAHPDSLGPQRCFSLGQWKRGISLTTSGKLLPNLHSPDSSSRSLNVPDSHDLWVDDDNGQLDAGDSSLLSELCQLISQSKARRFGFRVLHEKHLETILPEIPDSAESVIVESYGDPTSESFLLSSHLKRFRRLKRLRYSNPFAVDVSELAVSTLGKFIRDCVSCTHFSLGVELPASRLCEIVCQEVQDRLVSLQFNCTDDASPVVSSLHCPNLRCVTLSCVQLESRVLRDFLFRHPNLIFLAFDGQMVGEPIRETTLINAGLRFLFLRNRKGRIQSAYMERFLSCESFPSLEIADLGCVSRNDPDSLSATGNDSLPRSLWALGIDGRRVELTQISGVRWLSVNGAEPSILNWSSAKPSAIWARHSSTTSGIVQFLNQISGSGLLGLDVRFSSSGILGILEQPKFGDLRVLVCDSTSIIPMHVRVSGALAVVPMLSKEGRQNPSETTNIIEEPVFESMPSFPNIADLVE